MSLPTAVVAGASGFVGRALAGVLQDRFNVVGLSRRPPSLAGGAPGFSSWRSADLLNLRDAETALVGAEVAVYLVHSMMPTARLTQGSFADLDLLCADNFARAAARTGVRQIVYLGGLLPEGAPLSPHLESREEVEAVLASHGVPLTTLRAGLILGAGGASFEILTKLVRRLPWMICPGWTKNRMQPIALADVVRLLAFTLGREECFGETYDVGAREALSYRALLGLTAELLGQRRLFVPVPFFSPRLSRLWVRLVTSAPDALVGPLVESLRHEMVVRDQRLATIAALVPSTPREAMTAALEEERRSLSHVANRPAPRRLIGQRPRPPSLVLSVQRMRLPAGRNARWAAVEYARWLPVALRGLLRADRDPHGNVRFFLLFLSVPLLVLLYSPERSTDDHQLFFIGDGLLSRRTEHGRFELRQALHPQTLLVAIHDYEPRLPWFIYLVTQALFHAAVMAAFRRHLLKMDRPGDTVARPLLQK